MPVRMFINRYPSAGVLLKDLTQRCFGKMMQSKHIAYIGDFPVMSVIRRAFGSDIAEAILEQMIFQVSEFSGCREKLTPDKIEYTAKLIMDKYSTLKVSEFELFFHNFKMGHYGYFYGSVDPMVILKALESFMQEREMALQIIEGEQRRAQRQLDEANLQRLTERYNSRVPKEPNNTRLIDFLQYRLMGFDTISDQELLARLDRLRSGEDEMPETALNMLRYAHAD